MQHYLTVFNRVVLTSTSLEERAVVFVFFHFLLNKLAAGERLVIKCDHDTALKVLDEIPTSWGGFLCSLRSAVALLGRQLVGQVDNHVLDKIFFVSSWMGITLNCIRSFPFIVILLFQMWQWDREHWLWTSRGVPILFWYCHSFCRRWDSLTLFWGWDCLCYYNI